MLRQQLHGGRVGKRLFNVTAGPQQAFFLPAPKRDADGSSGFDAQRFQVADFIR